MKEFIGEVFVDAGCVWVGDPCYVMGEDSSSGPQTWSEYCEKLRELGHWDSGQSQCEPLGKGIGLHIQTLYGDGTYPVYAEINSDGKVTSFTVNFDDDEEVADDEWAGW